MKKEKVLLAFSGGLDTSFCAMYLAKDKGYEVHTAIANTGGFSPEELKRIEERAYRLGAKTHATLDVTQEYYDKSIKYMKSVVAFANGAGGKIIFGIADKNREVVGFDNEDTGCDI